LASDAGVAVIGAVVWAGAVAVVAGLASDAGFAVVWALADIALAANNTIRMESFMVLSDS
jgi:hypothetical protein